jgi:hypothetical protein
MANRLTDFEKLAKDCQILANAIESPVYLVGPSKRRLTKDFSIVTADSFFPREDLSIYFAAWPERNNK